MAKTEERATNPYLDLTDRRVVDALTWVAQEARALIMTGGDAGKTKLREALKALPGVYAAADATERAGDVT